MNSVAAVVLLLALGVSEAHAGGLFLPTRGVRPTARGGAFVAGADDLGALWFNPAGLAALSGGKEKVELLLDGAFVGHDVRYQRVDSGGNVQPVVVNDPQVLPIPTVAVAFDLSPKMTLGFGLLVPYTSLDGYPEDGAQRYSLVSLHGSLMVVLETAIGAKLSEKVWLGAGVQNLFLGFRSRVVFSSCPREVFCAPEDPEFDALGEVVWNDHFNLSGVLGAIVSPSKKIKVGAALQLPFWLDGDAEVAVRLPSSGFFEGSHVEGDQAAMSMTLPAVVRLGVEYSPSRRVRIELGLDREFWSQHDEISLDPKDIRVEDAAGVGVYDLGPMHIPRNLEDTTSVRVGLEALATQTLTVRAGYVFETGSAPDEWLSVMTVDGAKHLVAAGLGVQLGSVRVDATFAYVAVATRDVARGTSCAPQLNPIRSSEESPGPCAAGEVYVGDGTYESSWLVLGLGASIGF